MVKTLRDLSELKAYGLIAPDHGLDAIGQRYAIALTDAVLARIDRSNPNDPIARQFVPSVEEGIQDPSELADPIGDHAHMPVTGIVHRYPDRVLLKPVHVCPVYCRFCFRREMVGPGGDALSPDQLDATLDYIEGHPEIFEVILTGGDPLMLSARRMSDLISRLSNIPHVGVIRIHSRVPIADPARMDQDMIAALQSPKALWLSIHCNHAQELGPDQARVLADLSAAGIPLLSQSVLLHGVNDDVETLVALFRRLISLKVKPHYLHHPDLAPGTGHFRLTIAEGQALVTALWRKLPGPARPTYVLDIPGGHGKINLLPGGAEDLGDGQYRVIGLDGQPIIYPPNHIG
jgi:lysine 2,3-aminomutase